MKDMLYQKALDVGNDLFVILNKMATDKGYYNSEQREKLFKIRKGVGEVLTDLNNFPQDKSHDDCQYYDSGEINEYCTLTGMEICDDEICTEFKENYE